jgi:hypothetical protein
MTREGFISDLRAMGLELAEREPQFVMFPWTVPVGRLVGAKITLAFQVNGMNPPGGPHVSPRLLPMNPVAGKHPNGGIHPSDLGDNWQYWSRPFPNWAETDRSGRAYMAHIRHLFATL